MKKIMTIIIGAGLISVVTAGLNAQNQKYLTIKGSDTMVHLVSAWAETYMKENPGIEISVTGGGSGTGIAALINGTTDIAASSRDIKPKEVDLAKENNVMPLETKVALDGIAVAVNPANPVKELSMSQLKKIFTGEVDNWNQVGGNDEKIIVLSRESSSGTYVFFMEHVLDKHDYTKNARLMPATSAIVQAIAEDKTAIGYIGLGYAEESKNKIKVIPVKKDDNSTAVYPSEETVKNGSYPISRGLFLYTKTAISYSGIIREFLNFCLSEEGQKIVTDNGYVTVN